MLYVLHIDCLGLAGRYTSRRSFKIITRVGLTSFGNRTFVVSMLSTEANPQTLSFLIQGTKFDDESM